MFEHFRCEKCIIICKTGLLVEVEAIWLTSGRTDTYLRGTTRQSLRPKLSDVKSKLIILDGFGRVLILCRPSRLIYK
jgi:hypothetical protein